MRLVDMLLEQTLIYDLWQVPYTKKKFAPILRHNDLSRVRRVLDVGCGPGTSTAFFGHAEYLGIDINERYIRDARRRHHRDFLVADVTKFEAAQGARYDFVLVNSFLHHIDTPNVLRILSHLNGLLTEGGSVHILDLVMPPEKNMARLLAHADRGEFPRPVAEWREIFSSTFATVLFEPYPVKQFGTTLLEMVYFKGEAKR